MEGAFQIKFTTPQAACPDVFGAAGFRLAAPADRSTVSRADGQLLAAISAEKQEMIP
ncbi:hypothetical protein [Paracoccus contaminans]|uniref:hypothetical protein n=1 Tax=Paracoccus contaminans TaxID=1945662 RepID=UPI0012F520C1|nr:hypothetical protein [Paracoccus contaminans]